MKRNIFYTISSSSRFQHFILGVIIFSAILIGIETYPGLTKQYYQYFLAAEYIIQAIFTVEIVIRILAYGNRPLQFFASPTNLFDFIVTALFYIPYGGAYVSVLRLVRIFRVLRLITALPKLQILVGALIHSIPSMGYISLLLLIQFYIFAVLGTFLFGTTDPEHFGNLGTAMLTLFQIITLEGWVEIMEAQGNSLLAPLYFITFIIIGTMVILNLFIGVILNGFEDVQKDIERALEKKTKKTTRANQLKQISQQLEGVKSKLDLLIEKRK